MNRQAAEGAKVRRQEPGEALDVLAHQVIGADIEVHRELGPGFLEAVYEDVLATELAYRSIDFERQVEMPLHYKGRPLNRSHRLDLLAEKKLIVELKAVVDHHAVYEAVIPQGLRPATRSPDQLQCPPAEARYSAHRAHLTAIL